ncbi:MAG TPA: ABC transporter ATP-binding protein [Gemmatimonadaceae bacterium]|nr:ABC transporter ATP-binding protein [Gemmatimonadaceae bacterium]
MTSSGLTATQSTDALIDVQNLRVTFTTPAGLARAVDTVSFRIAPGETVGMVGESGCGKTVTGLSLLRLIEPPGRIDPSSKIFFEGRDLLTLSERDIRRVRGRRIAMVFQEPMTALNPVFTVGDQIAEVVRVHERAPRRAAWHRAVEMLERVGIASPAERAKQYPHQLSGGMRQRVLIGMALVMRPALLIADEPTTALDVTVQAQILELLRELQRDFGMAVLLITHDLGVIAETASRVLVMYGGEIVEATSVERLFANPQHPYTEGLLAAMPRVDDARERLTVIPGTVPPPTAWPSGCRFRDRCPYAWERAEREHPELYAVEPEHAARCFLVLEPERRALAAEPRA